MNSLKKTMPSPSPVPSTQTAPVSTPDPQKHDSSKRQRISEISYTGNKKDKTTWWPRGRCLRRIGCASRESIGTFQKVQSSWIFTQFKKYGQEWHWKTQRISKANRVLTEVQPYSGARKTWILIDEANDTITAWPPLAYLDKENVKWLQQYCVGRFPLFASPIPV